MEGEVLEYREIQVVESGVAEDVAPHIAKLPERRRHKERLAVRGGKATEGGECGRIRGIGGTATEIARSLRGGYRERAVHRSNYAAGARCTESATERDAILAGREIIGIANNVPAIHVFSGPADVVPAVEDNPRLWRLIGE